jgi:hypothetical protein
MGEPGEDYVIKLLHLLRRCPTQLRMPMAMRVTPPRGDAIDQLGSIFEH